MPNKGSKQKNSTSTSFFIYFFTLGYNLSSAGIFFNFDTPAPKVMLTTINHWKIDQKQILLNFFSFIFLIKIAIYLSLGFHKVSPNYRRSLFSPQKEQTELQKMKLLNYFFLDHFCPLGSWSGYGSRDPIEYNNAPYVTFVTFSDYLFCNCPFWDSLRYVTLTLCDVYVWELWGIVQLCFRTTTLSNVDVK